MDIKQVLDQIKSIFDVMGPLYFFPLIASVFLWVVKLTIRKLNMLETSNTDTLDSAVMVNVCEAMEDEEPEDTHCPYCRSYLVLNAYQCCTKCGAPHS